MIILQVMQIEIPDPVFQYLMISVVGWIILSSLITPTMRTWLAKFLGSILGAGCSLGLIGGFAAIAMLFLVVLVLAVVGVVGAIIALVYLWVTSLVALRDSNKIIFID